MNTGTVKWYNSSRGYGFIHPDAGGQDVFLHASAVEQAGLNTPQEGQKIGYELEPDRSGKMCACALQAV